MKKTNLKLKNWGSKETSSALPKRGVHHHKALSGKVLVIAGSKKMLGAGILSALAAARSGAGYVFLCAPPFQAKIPPQVFHPDVLFVPPDRDLNSKINRSYFQSIILGPGLEPVSFAQHWIRKLKKVFTGPIVLDAGGIEALAKMSQGQKMSLGPNWLLTPHEGEMAKLLGKTSSWVHQNRIEAALQTYQKFGANVLLKGAKTLYVGNDRNFKMTSGTPALSKAGTGDVLSGVIGGFLAQGLDLQKSACSGAYIHGKASQHWMKKKRDMLGLLASDLLIEIPEVIFIIRQKR